MLNSFLGTSKPFCLLLTYFSVLPLLVLVLVLLKIDFLLLLVMRNVCYSHPVCSSKYLNSPYSNFRGVRVGQGLIITKTTKPILLKVTCFRSNFNQEFIKGNFILIWRCKMAELSFAKNRFYVDCSEKLTFFYNLILTAFLVRSLVLIRMIWLKCLYLSPGFYVTKLSLFPYETLSLLNFKLKVCSLKLEEKK